MDEKTKNAIRSEFKNMLYQGETEYVDGILFVLFYVDKELHKELWEEM